MTRSSPRPTPWLLAALVALAVAGCETKKAAPEAPKATKAEPAAASRPSKAPPTRTASVAAEARPKSCGGRMRGKCEAGWYCEFSSASCDRADRSGTCVRYPEACAEGAPKMCSCDRDATYEDACAAKAAGESRLAPCGGS